MLTLMPEAHWLHADAACYLCHRVQDVVDTGRQIEGEGVLALCTNCISEMAVISGMDPQAEGEIETMAKLVSDLTAELKEKNATGRALRRQIRDLKAELALATAGATASADDTERAW